MKEERAEIFHRKRPYAPYFHFRDDKRGTEVGAVCDWLSARFRVGPDSFAALEYRQNPLDPPDVVLVDRSGIRHGIEVTEFVDGPTISAHLRDFSTDIREYGETEFRDLVIERITVKSNAPFKDVTCATKSLIIYSDEPFFICGDGVEFLRSFSAVNQSFFDEIWFMIPPAVNTSGGAPGNPHCRVYEIKRG